MKKDVIKISGMTCAGCSSGLEKFLNKQEGIIKAEVNLVMSNAIVEYDEKIVNLDKLAEYIEAAGFKSLGIDKYDEDEKVFKKDKIKLFITIVLGLILFVICILNIFEVDYLGINMNRNPKVYASVLAVLSTIIVVMSFNTIINGVKKLIHKMPNMDTLISIGVITSYLYSIYSLIMTLFVNAQYVNRIYFESAAMVLVFRNIGKYIDSKSKVKVKEAITKLMTITPTKATIIRDEYEIKVNIDEINKDEIVICRPGEKIAVDGEIVEGITHIDESFITGESVPKAKGKGDKVVAGSINLDGYIEYRAERIGKDTVVSEVVRTVVNSLNSKTNVEKIADRICRYFVPAILIIATISLITWLILGKSLIFAINIFISVLVVACPCALGLATPMANTVATGTSVKKGILIKNNQIFENLNKIDTVVFDKTGTLTLGKLRIDEIYKYGGVSENRILQLIGTLERKSEHPIAKAIIHRCIKQGIKIGQAREAELLTGLGIKSRYKGEDILIGSKKLMTKNNIAINEEDAQKLLETGDMVIFVAVDKELISMIGLKDTVKDEAKEVIENLNNNSLETIMLTGDNHKTAKLIGDELGISNIIANVLPKQKAKKIEEFIKKGKNVMMVGDGINDAPSLVKSNISVSMENGADIAIDSSDVVVMNGDLTRISTLFMLGKKTMRVIKQNIFWAFAYNIIMIPIAAGIITKLNIKLNPTYSAIAMTISSIIVVLNSLRIKRVK